MIFKLGTCETCDIEGQFPEDLICPECGGEVEEMVLVKKSEIEMLRAEHGKETKCL